MSTPSTAFAGPPRGQFGRPRPPVAPVTATAQNAADAVNGNTVADTPAASPPPKPTPPGPAESDNPTGDSTGPAEQADTAPASADAPPQTGETTADAADRSDAAHPAPATDTAPAHPPASSAAETKKNRARGKRTARKDAGGPGKHLVVISGGVASTDGDSVVVVDLDNANDADDAHEVVALLESLRGVSASALRDSTLGTLKELVVDKALS